MMNVCHNCGLYRIDKTVDPEGPFAICPECDHRHPFLLWRAEFDTPEDNYRDFFETWLRVCKNIGQSGRPVALFGAGVGVPANMEPCVERRYFSALHYLALVCDDDVLTDRLCQRPAWRQSSHEVYIKEHVDFNRWFVDNGPTMRPPIALLNTTELTVEETAAQVAAWIREHIS